MLFPASTNASKINLELNGMRIKNVSRMWPALVGLGPSGSLPHRYYFFYIVQVDILATR